jgi:uncharacterized SAM-binding protein YcdF (DUF218 family)
MIAHALKRHVTYCVGSMRFRLVGRRMGALTSVAMKGQEAVGDWQSPTATIFHRTRRRTEKGGMLRRFRNGALGLLAAGAVFAGGFSLFAHHISQLATPEYPETADAIIVLTGGQSRIDAAVDLLKSGKGQRLLISGVNPIADEDDLRAATGADADLFSCCVDIDHAALDTVGNAQQSAKWMRANAYDSVIVVTNNYHMPRSLLELRRSLGGADLKPYPVVNARLDGGEWMTKPQAIRVLFTEYTKYLASMMRGVVQTTATADELPAAKVAAGR